MAETEAQRTARIKSMTDAIEAAYKSTRVAFTKISGLLQIGQATCAEVRAYNLFALGIYDTQKSMLATLRATGQTGLPNLPTQPNLFAWKGMSGYNALNFPCGSKATNLSGLLGEVLRGPGPDTQFISIKDVEISTQGIEQYNPGAAPKLAEFVKSLEADQAMQQAQQGLGALPIVAWIVIAAVSISATTAFIAALAYYFTTSKIEEEGTKRYQQYAETYTAFLATRLKCIEDCVAKGNSQAGCTAVCERALPVPKNPAEVIKRQQAQQWSTLELVGLGAAVLVGGVVVYNLWQRKERTGSLLPSFSLPGE